VEIERSLGTPIKIFGAVAWSGPVPFSTTFSIEITNALCYGKVKAPTMDLYDGNTGPEEHLGVY